MSLFKLPPEIDKFVKDTERLAEDAKRFRETIKQEYDAPKQEHDAPKKAPEGMIRLSDVEATSWKDITWDVLHKKLDWPSLWEQLSPLEKEYYQTLEKFAVTFSIVRRRPTEYRMSLTKAWKNAWQAGDKESERKLLDEINRLNSEQRTGKTSEHR